MLDVRGELGTAYLLLGDSVCLWLLSLSSQQTVSRALLAALHRARSRMSPLRWDLSEPSCPGFLSSLGVS